MEIDFDRLTSTSASRRLTWNADRGDPHAGSCRPSARRCWGISNARQWTMSFRNDEQVDFAPSSLFDKGQRAQEYFRKTVVFECPVDVSLNWTLTPGGARTPRPADSAGRGPTRVEDPLERLATSRPGQDRLRLREMEDRAPRCPRLSRTILKQMLRRRTSQARLLTDSSRLTLQQEPGPGTRACYRT